MHCATFENSVQKKKKCFPKGIGQMCSLQVMALLCTASTSGNIKNTKSTRKDTTALQIPRSLNLLWFLDLLLSSD